MKNKAIKITLNVLTYVFIGLCVLLVIMTVTAKKSDGAINVFGHQARIVISESMEKCDKTDVSKYKIKDIPLKSMVFIELVPEEQAQASEWYKNLKVGDVLTFRYKYDRQETITHRIIEIKENVDGAGEPTGGYTITLRGDNVNLSEEGGASKADVGTQIINTDQVSVNYVIGKVTGQSKLFGFIIYTLKQPLGIALIIIIPSAIIMIFEIMKIVGIVSEEKKKKAQEEKEKQLSEIEALKKQLEELQQKTAEKTQTPE